MNAAEVMDKVFDIYKRSFFPQIGLNFMVYTIGLIIMYAMLIILALAGVFIGSAVTALNNPGFLSVPAIITLCVIGASIIIWIFIIYFNTITSATSLLSWLSFSGRPVNISYALRNTFRSFGRIITLSLAETISGIPVILLIALAVYAIFAGQGLFTRSFWQYDYFLSLFTPLNIILLLLIILSISFAVSVIYNYFALALPAAVFDRKHFFSALVSSYRLMKKHFWRILGIRFAFSGATMLISYSFTGLSSLLIGISAGLSNSFSPNQGGLMVVAIVIQYVFGMVTAVLLMPLDGIFTSVIFFNQKIKKEGLDLAMQLELLERANGL